MSLEIMSSEGTDTWHTQMFTTSIDSKIDYQFTGNMVVMGNNNRPIMRERRQQYLEILKCITDNPKIEWIELAHATRLSRGRNCRELTKILESLGMIEMKDEGTYLTPKGDILYWKLFQENEIMIKMVPRLANYTNKTYRPPTCKYLGIDSRTLKGYPKNAKKNVIE